MQMSIFLYISRRTVLHFLLCEMGGCSNRGQMYCPVNRWFRAKKATVAFVGFVLSWVVALATLLSTCMCSC